MFLKAVSRFRRFPVLALCFSPLFCPDWGFFGHKRINRMAATTLPPEMQVFFKPNIDYLADHAVDPDMRRYALSWEAPRHYIDLDQYHAPDSLPPVRWLDALLHYTEVKGITASGDTLRLYAPSDSLQATWKGFFAREIIPRFHKEDKNLPLDSLLKAAEVDCFEIPPALQEVFFTESLSEHGILPWNLQQMYHRLVRAFAQKDQEQLLKLCADLGHYIGDAHVPLHTTSNYNGQKTGQLGIHGFWESRIPELFADEEYDYLVGKPEYISDPSTYFWKITLDSHQLVDSVLGIEWMLRKYFPSNRQLCPDVRQGQQVWTQCREFAAAYQERMKGMVEERMRASIHAISSVWYSAWIDAGLPDLNTLNAGATTTHSEEAAELLQRFGEGKIMGRPEEH